MPYCNVLREAITEDDDDERWDKSCNAIFYSILSARRLQTLSEIVYKMAAGHHFCFALNKFGL